MLQLGSFSVFPRKKTELLLLCSAVVECALNSASPPVLFWASAGRQALSSARYTSKALMSWGCCLQWNKITHLAVLTNTRKKNQKTKLVKIWEDFQGKSWAGAVYGLQFGSHKQGKEHILPVWQTFIAGIGKGWNVSSVLELQFVNPSWLHFQPRAPLVGVQPELRNFLVVGL